MFSVTASSLSPEQSHGCPFSIKDWMWLIQAQKNAGKSEQKISQMMFMVGSYTYDMAIIH